MLRCGRLFDFMRILVAQSVSDGPKPAVDSTARDRSIGNSRPHLPTIATGHARSLERFRGSAHWTH